MRIKINGKEVEELERQEQHYFEVIKSAVYFIIGAILVVCLPGVLHAITGLPFDIGADRIIDAFKVIK